ncbi:MAG: hypothetical protein GDA55_03795 [Cellvibrionales bacterium]|nr:hypothetical protein [Cellvibrionales bacterium]
MPGGPAGGRAGAGSSGNGAATSGAATDGPVWETAGGVANGTSGSGAPAGGAGQKSATVGNGADLPVWESPAGRGDGADQSGEGQAQSSGAGRGDGGQGTGAEVDLEELERTLDEALGTFDAQILREQENVRVKSDGAGEAGGAGIAKVAGVGEFAVYDGPAGRPPALPSSSTGAGSSATTDGAPSNRGNADGAAAPAGLESADIPPPSPDDDVVARQIREAALNEPDPAQRALLWEEYKRYKGEK